MRPTPSVAIAAALTATVLAVPGCAPRAAAPAETSFPASSATADAAQTTAVAPQDPALPDPGALTDVLYRLADPAVPGAEKLNLVQGATDTDIPTVDRFASAMRDNGYRPATFTAAEIRWAAEADTVLADVTIAKTDSDSEAGSDFALPMEFTRSGPVWQLSRDTFDTLLDSQPAAPEPPR